MLGQRDCDHLGQRHGAGLAALRRANRIETAALVSQSSFDAAETVVIARADDYPDALGAPLATHLGGPLLLSGSGQLAARPQPRSPGSAPTWCCSAAKPPCPRRCERTLEAMGVTVTRIGHENRFGTAALIMDALPDSDEAFVVEGRHADPGRGWPDALSASGLAAAEGKPVLLVDHANLPEETANTVSGDLDVIIVGGLLRSAARLRPRSTSGQ